MNRVPGAWRQTCTFSRVTSVGRLELLVDERAQHREQQRHQQRRRAALAGDVAERDDQPAVVERQDVVEVAADGVRGPAEPTVSTPGAL